MSKKFVVEIPDDEVSLLLTEIYNEYGPGHLFGIMEFNRKMFDLHFDLEMIKKLRSKKKDGNK